MNHFIYGQKMLDKSKPGLGRFESLLIICVRLIDINLAK